MSDEEIRIAIQLVDTPRMMKDEVFFSVNLAKTNDVQTSFVPLFICRRHDTQFGEFRQ